MRKGAELLLPLKHAFWSINEATRYPKAFAIK